MPTPIAQREAAIGYGLEHLDGVNENDNHSQNVVYRERSRKVEERPIAAMETPAVSRDIPTTRALLPRC